MQFFTDFFGTLREGEAVHIRAFNRKNGEVGSSWHKDPEKIVQGPTEGWDVYFGVNPVRENGKGKAAVTRIHMLHADMDFKHFASEDAAKRVLWGFELKPTFVVHSGGGYHVYWRLAEEGLENNPANVAYVESLMSRLYERLGGLDKVQDISRILRVPGTYNHKYDEPRESKALFQQDNSYTLADFERVLPEPEPDLPREVAGERNYRLPTEDEIRELLSYVPAQQDYRDWLKILVAVHSVYPDERGVRLIQEWSPSKDSFGQDNTAEKFASFHSTRTTVGTLYKSAMDHGWEPPKGPKLRVVHNRVVKPESKKIVLREWARMLDGYPPLERAEMPHYMRLLHEYMTPLTRPFMHDWTEMLFLSFYSAMWPRTRFENLNLSLWFLGLAPQGVGKSISLDELSAIFRDIAFQREQDIPLFTSGTTRGMANRLSGQGKQLLCVFSEYVGFLKSLNADHNSGMKEVMCDLYDGRSFSHQKAEDTIAGDEPFIVVAGTTTVEAFRENAKREDMLNGYMSRFLFAAPDVLDIQPSGMHRLEERQEVASLLAEHVQTYSHIDRVEFAGGPNPPLLKQYIEGLGLNTGTARNLDEEVGKEVEIPWGRVIARIKKLASLLELLEEKPNVDEAQGVLKVHDRNLALAIRLAHRGAAYHKRALGFMFLAKDDEAVQKVTKQLEKRGQMGVRELIQYTHLEGMVIERALKLLQQEGLADYNETGNSVRRKRYWFLVPQEV